MPVRRHWWRLEDFQKWRNIPTNQDPNLYTAWTHQYLMTTSISLRPPTTYFTLCTWGIILFSFYLFSSPYVSRVASLSRNCPHSLSSLPTLNSPAFAETACPVLHPMALPTLLPHTVVPQHPWGTGSRTPCRYKTCRCSSPLYKMALYLHTNYAHPPAYFKSAVPNLFWQ